MYGCYFINVLTQRSCFEVLLTADSQCFTRDDARTFVPTIPRRWRAFTVSWNIEVFVHSNSASRVVNFFPPGVPSPVSSTSQSPPSFPSPSLSTRRNQLSPRSSSSRKHSNVQLVPACVASGNIHNAVSRHLDKNRAKHRRTVFSMKKAQESKQRSTSWRRRHLGDIQQQPRRWPGFDKWEETKLRLDVYIRPWPPGWSFLRRTYTSRGSERVNLQHTIALTIDLRVTLCYVLLSMFVAYRAGSSVAWTCWLVVSTFSLFENIIKRRHSEIRCEGERRKGTRM